jgi:hypothetical protein
VHPFHVRGGWAPFLCSHAVLQNARSPAGRFIPLTAADVRFELIKAGFFLNQRDVEGLLREVAVAGDAIEIDAAAGFRWNGRVA